MSGLGGVRAQQLRGVILKLIRINQKNRGPRMDDMILWGNLRDLQHDVGINEVRTALNDLHDLAYLDYKELHNDFTNAVSYHKLRIESKGVKLVEGISTDPSVEVVR